MTKDTQGLTSSWAIKMEEMGYITTDDVADLMDRFERAREASLTGDNTEPLYEIVKEYHNSEFTDGANFRTLFGAMLVFAREVDPDLEDDILEVFSYALSTYIDIKEGMRQEIDEEAIGDMTLEEFARKSFYSRLAILAEEYQAEMARILDNFSM